MCRKLLCLLLVAGQVILNGSTVIREKRDTVESETSTTTGSANLPEGYVAFPEDHAAYKLNKTLTDWTHARDQCIAEGARLAIADTLDKVKHINSLRNEPMKWRWIHVGFMKNDLINKWVRVDDGLPAENLPWLRNYPRTYQNCAGISVNYDALVDYVCNSTDEYYVCEIPL